MTDHAAAHTGATSLRGKRVIVTGGTTGIGRAIAVLLASEGARVHVCGRTPDHLAEAVAAINAVGEAAGSVVDLAQADEIPRYFGAATDWLGGLDIAIINAAVPAGGLTDITEPELRHAIAVNFSAYLLSAHAAVAAMAGGPGDIIMTGSLSTRVLGPSSTVYAGIKAGITGFAEALRKELGEKDIKVGLVEPGLTQAAMHLPTLDAAAQQRKIDEETMLRSADIAVAVHFMLTQPRRSTIQSMTIVPRRSQGE